MREDGSGSDGRVKNRQSEVRKSPPKRKMRQKKNMLAQREKATDQNLRDLMMETVDMKKE